MQVTTDRMITDEESVVLGSEKIVTDSTIVKTYVPPKW